MANYNKIMMIGNLTRDPQLTYTPNQTAVVDFGLATNRKWTAQDGSQREETCFVDCRAFSKTADTINKYLTKGKSVFIEGRLTFDSWTAQDGTKRSKHRITVESFQFLDSRDGNRRSVGMTKPQVQPTLPTTKANDEFFSKPPIDDDIPF